MQYEDEFDENGFIKDRDTIDPKIKDTRSKIKHSIYQVVKTMVDSEQDAQDVILRIENKINELASHVYIHTDWINTNSGR